MEGKFQLERGKMRLIVDGTSDPDDFLQQIQAICSATLEATATIRIGQNDYRAEAVLSLPQK